MFIGNLKIENPVFLAPMAGVTDIAYRIVARRMGCGLVYAEMVSDKGIHFRNEHTLRMLETEKNERPLVMQLFGETPESLSEAAKYVESLGCADIIDINMGCPAPKIVKNHEGSALMLDPKRAFAIMSAVKKAVNIPVTVKMRKGWDNEHINVVEMAKLAQEAGMDAIAVHGRTREQFYSGRADWDIIAVVKQAVNIPVIGNGDVRTCNDLQKIFDQTNCDAVMIGRAAQGNPWIFREFVHFLRTGEKMAEPTMQERKEIILEHLDMLLEKKGSYIGPREMRKHATWYTRGITGGAELRRLFNLAEKRDDFVEILSQM
ncbi:tRNA dihydrouridine synthase DusB [Pectinatus brassicae]|uniref:tRNA-dihydrouridine synthase n=1 Tax=Pectinatus brassicae TaxID=862415 RepID=A0A840ULB4_9FIRM|nr:tRNA dihydrouridine synthase DusB [Pectinatus brassicae]MBB5335498.1 nifR3 family TIM-barrel protein [Pectinatus brassicae]